MAYPSGLEGAITTSLMAISFPTNIANTAANCLDLDNSKNTFIRTASKVVQTSWFPIFSALSGQPLWLVSTLPIVFEAGKFVAKKLDLKKINIAIGISEKIFMTAVKTLNFAMLLFFTALPFAQGFTLYPPFLICSAVYTLLIAANLYSKRDPIKNAFRQELELA